MATRYRWKNEIVQAKRMLPPEGSDKVHTSVFEDSPVWLIINIPHGKLVAPEGHWLVRTSAGKYYTLSHEAFMRHFQEVEYTGSDAKTAKLG